jgi:hypothetical protein
LNAISKIVVPQRFFPILDLTNVAKSRRFTDLMQYFHKLDGANDADTTLNLGLIHRPATTQFL